MGNVELPHWLKQLPLAPEFRPTDTEFADPIAYISKIEREVGAFGICKVIPPLPKPSKRYVFNNLNKTLLRTRELGLDVNLGETRDLSKRVIQDKRNVNESRAVFTTRQQELGKEVKRSRGEVDAAQPGAQKQVWQSGELYTLKQFESKSKAFSRSVLGMVKEVTPLVVEAMFWKAASEKPMYVEYANDVPGSGFGEPEGFSFPVCKKRRMCSQRLGGRSYGRQQGATKLCAGLEGKLLEPSLSSLSELGKECTEQPTSSLDESSQSTRQNVLCTNAELEGTAGWKLSNCPWNLQVIARSAGSLTRFMLNDIPGVTSPMVYIGMLFSWFAWHVEDHELHSLNFLHTGSPKTWYAIPGEYAFAFEDVIRKQAYGGDMDHLAALKILGEKTTLLSPEVVVASGIPCCRLVQNPGEYVVTFPRAYHIGFSHGFNVGEAANFGTPQWLTIAKEAAVRRAAMDHLPMLSHQQLLYLLTMSFILRVPRIMLPGVRSSRLRNRLKEERELLVKKAFIEDVLKENHLLNILIGKGTAFRAVLWHPDSLPSLARVSQAGTILDDLLVKDAELSVTPSKDVNEYMHHLNSDKNTMNDLYLDSTDILCDFQVDSGTLVCVTCGILGYPMMSVVQPSKRASMKYFSAGKMSQYGVVDTSQQPDLRHAQCSTKISFPETTNDETWDTSAFFKPRIFCLEHAVQIEELLRPKGGAKILVICHSDYQKIKANAAAVAEELRTTFNYKEVCFDSATQEELKLIEMTIDDEQLADFQEDWTSELGINLRFSVKTRKGCLPKKMEHVLNVDYLLSIMAPVSRIANIKWCCRKSRTKRLPNYRTLATYCDGNFSKKDEVSHVSNSMKVRGKVLLQYYRRKYRTKSRISSGDKYVSECSMTFSTEVTNADCTKSNDHNEQDTLGECFKIAETVSEEDSLDKLFVVYGESCDRSSEVVITDAFTLTSSASNLLRTAGVVEDPNNANEDLNVEICSGSPASTLPHVGNPSAGKDMVVVNGCTSRASNPTLMCRPEELNDEQAGGSSTSDHTFLSAYNSEVSSSSLPENSNKHEVYGNAGFNKMENLGDTETCKHDTTSVELDMCNLPKESFNDGCQRGAHASSLLSKNKRLANAKRPSRDKSKGSKKLQTEAQNSYIRSPCEGLRPRKNKVNSVHTLVGNIYEMAEEKPPTKKLRKSSGSSASCNQGLDSKTSYKCNVEGCQLFFRTKVQLSLHNDNKCHHKKCGKKFRSHKYVVLHQRVHDDERPLKCTWAGCTMTFKWAWARTEHLRLHTGERPYQCKIKGCGLTFRFVSDFSRHRRKFGHYVAPTK